MTRKYTDEPVYEFQIRYTRTYYDLIIYILRNQYFLDVNIAPLLRQRTKRALLLHKQNENYNFAYINLRFPPLYSSTNHLRESERFNERIIMYRDIGAYVTIHIVTHDMLLVAVYSHDFDARPPINLECFSFLVAEPHELAQTGSSEAIGDPCRAQLDKSISVRLNEAVTYRLHYLQQY